MFIATEFTDDQRAAILDGATEWQQASGNYVTFDAADSSSSTDIITFKADTATEMTAEFGGGAIGDALYQGESSRVDLLISLDPLTFHQTVLHEIGHAIGLIHTTPGNIMCRDTTCATLEVTCGDLKQLMHQDVPGCFP